MRRISPHIIAVVGGVLIVVLLLAYVASTRRPNQDKLNDSEIATKSPASPEKRCASQATYDLIKRELFRRAAQVRGADQAAFDRLSAYAVVRMENPVVDDSRGQTGGVNCSGSLSLDLPPGVAVVGGRRTLMSDVDYSVQPAADGSGNVVLLRNADAIIMPLATLARTAQVPAQTEVTPEAPPATPPAPAPQPSAPAPQAAQQPEPAPARPSFDCGSARTRGEQAVCSDAGLAGLDRNMASQYARAASNASPDQRTLLRETAHRFYAYRDRCPDNRCVADAYAGRMREIRDIMEGRWQPPR